MPTLTITNNSFVWQEDAHSAIITTTATRNRATIEMKMPTTTLILRLTKQELTNIWLSAGGKT